MSSDGGLLSLESPYSPHGSSVYSGLISWFETRYPTCSVCMLPLSWRTFVTIMDPTVPPVLSLPGADRTWICVRSAAIVPSRRCFACTKRPSPSRVPDGVTARGSHVSDEQLGLFRSTITPVCVGFRLAATAPGQTVPPGMASPGPFPTVFDNPGAPLACTKPPAVSPQASTPLLKPWVLRPPPAISIIAVETLLRASGPHTALSVRLRPIPGEVCFGCDSTPGSIASRCGRRSRYRTS
jgi:hypothetical protein